MNHALPAIRLLLAAVLLAVAAACDPPPPPPPDLQQVVADVWAPGTLPVAEGVTWQVGVPTYNGEIMAGLAEGFCVLTWCTWTITIHPDYVNEWVVAHEGGHVVCWALYWFDQSEACADRIAAETLANAVP